MKTSNSSQKSGDMSCIWMASGLVKYKLCDKEFDCDNCEFDKVFRNLSTKMSEPGNSLHSANTDLVERLIKRINNEVYDTKVKYLKNQLVIKNLFGNAFYLGINPLVLYLLDDFQSLYEFNNNEIKKDQIIFTVEGNWGVKKFVSPINFMVIEKINFSKFKLNQWYSVILFNEFDKEDYLTQEEWETEKQNLISNLKEHNINKPAIGQTMMDGGEKVNNLHQYLGSEGYLKLLNEVFK